MARTRKTEPDLVVSAAAAAPARRNTATAQRKPRPSATATAAATAATPATDSAPAVTVEEVLDRRSPAQEEIATLAYSYWVMRGYEDGCPEEDWLRAEQELLSVR
jgi:hypothetical protein